MIDVPLPVPRTDLFPILAALLAAVTCGLLGNFLVLRKLSLMGDAISHAVLPGLAAAFMLTATRSPPVMFAGAAIAGVATVVLVEVVKRLGRVEAGAAMGVVFSVMFAFGVLLIEQAARHIDLDADCVLHGQLETLVWWDGPADWTGVLSPATIQAVPRQVWTLLGMCALAAIFIAFFFKELRLAAFDSSLATALGFNAGILHYVLMIFVAAATVASFEAVGSILVIAMLICPAATARLLTDRLLTQLLMSVVIAALSAILGYAAASVLPALFGPGHDSVNAAGMMAVDAGVLLAGGAVFSPSHGIVMKMIRRRRVAGMVAIDDLLAALYRLREVGEATTTRQRLEAILVPGALRRALTLAASRGLISQTDSTISLSSAGASRASDVVRRHRLWESYLVTEAGFAPDHVHDVAERLEHTAIGPRSGPKQDPHGQQIPDAHETSSSD